MWPTIVYKPNKKTKWVSTKWKKQTKCKTKINYVSNDNGNKLNG